MTEIVSQSATMLVSESPGFSSGVSKTRGFQWSGSVEVFYQYYQWEIDALKGVLELERLPANWDGYGSPPPTSTAVNTAIILLRSVATTGFDDLPRPHVTPLQRGGVQLQWGVGAREVELFVSHDGAVEFLRAEAGEPLQEGLLRSLRYDQMRSLFAWLMSAATL